MAQFSALLKRLQESIPGANHSKKAMNQEQIRMRVKHIADIYKKDK